MKHLDMHPDLLEFISSLSRLQKILSQYEEGFWLIKINRIKQIAESSDGYCVGLFLGLYGGMGSFNDLVLDAPSSVNDLLHKERSLAYELAKALR